MRVGCASVCEKCTEIVGVWVRSGVWSCITCAIFRVFLFPLCALVRVRVLCLGLGRALVLVVAPALVIGSSVAPSCRTMRCLAFLVCRRTFCFCAKRA